MAKRPDFEPLESARGWVVNVPSSMTASGKRARKYFPTETAAKRFAASVRASHASGVRGAMISASLALQAAEALRILEGSGVSLPEAARLAVAKLGGAESRETFGDRYARAMAANDCVWSDKYQSQMDDLPKWLPASFMQRVCGVIDRAAIEAACREIRPSLKQSSLDMKASRILAIVHFRPRHKKAPSLAILTPAQVGRCLRVCESIEERRVVAVLFFAGVRPDAEFGEISRLDWSAFGDDVIEVSSEVSKTPSDRHIPITPRLRRLIRGHPPDGMVMPSGWKKRWQRIRRDAGIAELIDVARHVYCSNMLAAFGMEACQAAMGHVPLSQVTRRHYARAVLKPAAVRFFR
jgi:integrase